MNLIRVERLLSDILSPPTSLYSTQRQGNWNRVGRAGPSAHAGFFGPSGEAKFLARARPIFVPGPIWAGPGRKNGGPGRAGPPDLGFRPTLNWKRMMKTAHPEVAEVLFKRKTPLAMGSDQVTPQVFPIEGSLVQQHYIMLPQYIRRIPLYPHCRYLWLHILFSRTRETSSSWLIACQRCSRFHQQLGWSIPIFLI